MMSKPKDEQELGFRGWVEWLLATMGAAVVITAFMFMNFETKSDARDKKVDLNERLTRIEQKLDKSLEAKQSK